jgi:hypothetical protein
MDEITWALKSFWEWWKCKNVEYDQLTPNHRFNVNAIICILFIGILVSSPWIGALLIGALMIGRTAYQYSVLPSNYDGHHGCGGNCKCSKSDEDKDDIDNVRG